MGDSEIHIGNFAENRNTVAHSGLSSPILQSFEPKMPSALASLNVRINPRVEMCAGDYHFSLRLNQMSLPLRLWIGRPSRRQTAPRRANVPLLACWWPTIVSFSKYPQLLLHPTKWQAWIISIAKQSPPPPPPSSHLFSCPISPPPPPFPALICLSTVFLLNNFATGTWNKFLLSSSLDGNVDNIKRGGRGG